MSDKKTERIDIRLSKEEKEKLLKLAKSKGCEGITQLMRLIGTAKNVKIEL